MELKDYNRIVAVGVDIQNDFCPGGALAVVDGDQVVEPFNQVTRQVREMGGQVVFTRDWHPTMSSHFNEWPPHCIQNTQGAEFHSKLVIHAEDLILSKGMGANDDAYSGFEAQSPDGQTLESILSPRQEAVAAIIGGLATDYCVKATVLDALNLSDESNQGKLDVYVLIDAIKAVELKSGDSQQAIEEMSQAGAKFINSQELLNQK